MNKVTLRWKNIQEYLKTHDYIINADVRKLCVVSAANLWIRIDYKSVELVGTSRVYRKKA